MPENGLLAIKPLRLRNLAETHDIVHPDHIAASGRSHKRVVLILWERAPPAIRSIPNLTAQMSPSHYDPHPSQCDIPSGY